MKKSFVYGVAVTDYNFTGREAEIRHLKANFENGINSILISPRRYGKTSLVNYVCRSLSETDIIIVRLDIFGCKTEYEFYNMLAAAVLKQTATKVQQWMEEARDFLARLTPKIGIPLDPTQEVNVSLGITPQTHSPEEILNLVETIAQRKQRRIVVCIDEFQEVGEFADTKHVQGRLRAAWQHHHYASYCLFGSKRHMMSKIFMNRSMPFYQFGDLIWLEKIPTADWTDYIVSHFSDAGRHISAALANSICKVVDDYPSYVQQLASIVLNHLEPGTTATEEVLRESVRELLLANEALFMQQIEPLTVYQMNMLRAIVSGIHSGYSETAVRRNFDLGSPSNIVRLREALKERDLAYSELKLLYITDPVFALWFKMRFL
ncbi:MAG: ATP-binding protein [Prevotella sp.]|nr:ATP-binding protein [Prevotella sp.]